MVEVVRDAVLLQEALAFFLETEDKIPGIMMREEQIHSLN